MKYLLLITLICSSLQVVAQRQISASESITGVDEVSIVSTWGNVEVKNWDEKSIKLEGSVSINEGLNDDDFDFKIERNGNKLHICTEIPNMEDLPQYLTYEIEGQRFRRVLDAGERFDWKNMDEEVKGAKSVNVGVLTDISLILYVPTNLAVSAKLTYGDLDLSDCANHMDLTSTYGHIEASFSSQIPQQCIMTSTYSFVDVTLPSSGHTDISLQTSYGDIYTNLDVRIDNRMSTNKVFKSKIVGSINNGGGSKLDLRANYGNIYLRGK